MSRHNRQSAATAINPAEMGPTPSGNPPATPQGEQTAKRPNRFDGLFGSIVFQAINRSGNNEPLKLRDGGTSERISHAIIEMGNTKAYYEGAFIVRRVFANGDFEFRLQWPSSGGAFKKPMINTSEDENAHNDLLAFGNKVVDEWKAWRKIEVRKGNAAHPSSTTRQGVRADDAEMKELGF